MAKRAEVLSVSMEPEYVRALDMMAAEEGERKRSPIVRRLIEREMRKKFGPDWKREVACQHAA